jgi:thioredoxin 1
LAPVLEEIASEQAGKLAVFKLDIDQNAEATTNYKIKGIPTLLLFKNGKVVEQIVGAVPKATLLNILQKNL